MANPYDPQMNPRREARNVLGGPLKDCSVKPMTGFFRDGCCRTSDDDRGRHVVCVELTAEFLEFSKSKGNDLSTPRPEFGFAGLKPGQQWCLCGLRWVEAYQAGVAPRIYIESTEAMMREWVDIEILKKYALDLA